jgi:hypothetical protein
MATFDFPWQSGGTDFVHGETHVKALVAASVLCLAGFAASAAPPSAQSLERLLKAIDAEQTVKNLQRYSDAMMKSAVDRAVQTRQFTPEQRAKLDESVRKISVEMGVELSWEGLRPVYMQVYTETFTQEEIDSIIAFYESPAGRAFIAKMPTVLQKSTSFIQSRMDGFMQRMQGAIRETLEAK